jgi:tetratricopeptide (TPR) repeat protein
MPNHNFDVPLDIEGAFCDEYALVAPKGRGSQGTVYYGHMRDGDLPVAVKVLHHGFSDDFIERFKSEVLTLTSLDHDHIVKIYQYGHLSDDRPFMVTELVDGEFDIVEYARFYLQTVRQKVELFCKVVDAIAHAHESGFIHRDLKPSNLLVDLDGRPFVLDFGLCKNLREHVYSTGRPVALGTLAYMPPEQVKGSSGTRGDVYSLGLVLYEMIVGEMPITMDGVSEEGIIHQIFYPETGPWRKKLTQVCDPDLCAIVMKAISKEANERYADAVAFRDEVDRYLAGKPVVARSHQRTYRVRKWVKSNFRSAAIACALIIAAAGAIGFYLERAASTQIAHDATLKMQLGGFLKLSKSKSKKGDEGEAVELLENTIDEGLPFIERDPGIRRLVVESYQSLADLHSRNNHLIKAEAMARAAVDVSEGGPSRDEEWMRLRTFCWRSLAMILAKSAKYEEANRLVDQCLEVRRALAQRHPANSDLIAELARALHTRGKYIRKTGGPAQALPYYEEAYETFVTIHNRTANVASAISVVYSAIQLSACLITLRDDSMYERALSILDNGELILTAVAHLRNQSEVQSLQGHIKKNRDIINRRR